jgi:hypothetical protein
MEEYYCIQKRGDQNTHSKYRDFFVDLMYKSRGKKPIEIVWNLQVNAEKEFYQLLFAQHLSSPCLTTST